MEGKKNPVTVKNHIDFWEFLKELQNDRINKGKETCQDKVALWRLTKTIRNYFLANEKSYKAIVEVDINGINN